MTDPYTYCSACGGKLSEGERRKYVRSDGRGGPVLCRECVGKFLSELKDLMAPMLDEFNRAMTAVGESLVEELNKEDDNE